MQYCTNRDHQIFYKLRIHLACEFDIEFQGLQRLLLLVPFGVGRVKSLMQQRPNSFLHSANILVERRKLLIIFCNFSLQTAYRGRVDKFRNLLTTKSFGVLGSTVVLEV